MSGEPTASFGSPKWSIIRWESTGRENRAARSSCLEDTDGDGRYDKRTVFADQLNFPNGIFPWGKGVLVTAAPDILYLADTDSDGRADKREVLYTGFREGNQQHRPNGLVRGLDNWIYCAGGGDSAGLVPSTKTGKKTNIGNRDFRIRPETGEIAIEFGTTQFLRSRDDWGDWFGNHNANPMWQFVLEERYLRRNPLAFGAQFGTTFRLIRAPPASIQSAIPRSDSMTFQCKTISPRRAVRLSTATSCSVPSSREIRSSASRSTT